MRARLPLTASITFVLGLELSTGFMEYALRQYSNGIETFLNPNLQPDYVGMVGGTVFMVVGAFGLVTWAWTTLAIDDVGHTKLCPNCGSDTRRIRRGLAHRVLSAVTGRPVDRRACSRCTWKGLVYRA